MGSSASESLEDEETTLENKYDDDNINENRRKKSSYYEYDYKERKLTYYMKTSVMLSPCEKNAITYVQTIAMQKSNGYGLQKSLLKKMKGINNKWNKDTLDKLYEYIQWKVPIIVHVHCQKTIPLLLKDTHYRNLFETKSSSGCKNTKMRSDGEKKLFGPAYDTAIAFERPKYGCLNIGLSKTGCKKALSYGDGYFILNDETIRWRTTITIIDSLNAVISKKYVASDTVCGTLKHCTHLLAKLNDNELKELIQVAIGCKKGDTAQSSYREVQIHGPVQLNRDIKSLHVPRCHWRITSNIFQNFCDKNGCDLVWF
eukprot:361499_1